MGRKRRGKVSEKNKMLSIIPKILYNILVFLCVVLIAIIVMQRLTDSNRSVGGYKIFKVVSGSMIPKYDIGEVVISKDTPIENIKVGDAIVYRGKIGSLKGKIVMHEVVDIHLNENNQLEFYAKGLQNSKGDPEISGDQILGVVKIKSVILALLYKLATSIYSSFFIITILVINVFVSFKSGDKEIEELPAGKKSETKSKKVKQSESEIEIQEIENDDQEDDIEEDDIEEDDIEEDDIEEDENENTEQNENIKDENDNDNVVENNKEKIDKTESKVTKKNTKKSISEKQTEEEKEKTVIDTKDESDKIKDVNNSKTRKSVTKKEKSKSVETENKDTIKKTSKKNK